MNAPDSYGLAWRPRESQAIPCDVETYLRIALDISSLSDDRHATETVKLDNREPQHLPLSSRPSLATLLTLYHTLSHRYKAASGQGDTKRSHMSWTL